jgi:hypothetical protein
MGIPCKSVRSCKAWDAKVRDDHSHLLTDLANALKSFVTAKPAYGTAAAAILKFNTGNSGPAGAAINGAICGAGEVASCAAATGIVVGIAIDRDSSSSNRGAAISIYILSAALGQSESQRTSQGS